jgi:uncharacterized protein
MTRLHGKFVWFEHISSDPPVARRFYDALFGWRSEDVQIDGDRYHMIRHGEVGIGGLRRAPPEDADEAYWLSYLSVDDVDTAMARAVAAGGLVLAPPTDFASVGRSATLRDPTGAVVALWRGNQDDRPDPPMPLPQGEWCWNELMTPDPDAAIAFYTSAFGYSVQHMPMSEGGEGGEDGEDGTYHLLLAEGKPRAGIVISPEAGVHARWLPYVAVDTPDATAERAVTLGGKLLVPPRDIPGVGRFSVLRDPLGAVVVVFRDQMTAQPK